MSGYARVGDLASIRAQIGVAEADGVFVDARRLFAVLIDYVIVGNATSSDIGEVIFRTLTFHLLILSLFVYPFLTLPLSLFLPFSSSPSFSSFLQIFLFMFPIIIDFTYVN